MDFNYDLLGNPSGTGYVINVLNQLLESPSYVYQYDLRGNLIQQTSKLTSKVMDFIWSVDNKLMQVEIKNNGTDVSGRMGFGYDALGRRVSKTWQDFSAPANSYAKTFIYDREDLVMEVQNEKVTAFYVHAPGIDNPIAILRDMNNNQEFDDDEVFFYTKDHLGSIRELVGLDGKLKQRQRYTAYGVTTREKNTDQMDRLIDHAYGFTGRELDSETGLYFYRARYYQPWDYVGRFISRDPISFRGGDSNLYSYVQNNSINTTDPTGNNPFAIAGGVAGGVIGGITGGTQSSASCFLGVAADTIAGAATGFAGGFLLGFGLPSSGLLAAGALSVGGAVAGLGPAAISIFGDFGSSFCSPPPPPPPPPSTPNCEDK